MRRNHCFGVRMATALGINTDNKTLENSEGFILSNGVVILERSFGALHIVDQNQIEQNRKAHTGEPSLRGLETLLNRVDNELESHLVWRHFSFANRICA